MKYLQVVIVLVVALSFCMTAEAAINEGFDNFQNGVRPRGWTFAYCSTAADADMTHFGALAPSITMDAYGDQITTIQFNQSTAGTVQFWAEALASNPSSALLVREYDGSTWSRVTMIYGLNTIGVTYGPLAMNPSGSQQIEFTYKDADNNTDIYLDDVVVTNAATPVPSPTADPVLGPTPVYQIVDWDDYDGDGTSDIAVYDSSTGDWDIRNIDTVNFGGGANDIPVPGDYDGDGAADLAYFDWSTGQWYAEQVDTTPIINGETFGEAGDLPAPGDYDGDGTVDLATWRQSDGRWRIKDITNVWYGAQATMYPVPGDYDGDGNTDIAIFDPAKGTWYVKDIRDRAFWSADAVPYPMDFAGDGTTELGYFRASTGYWTMRQLAGPTTYTWRWGIPSWNSMPFVIDFNGDGVADLGAFRFEKGAAGRWLIRQTNDATGTWLTVDWAAQSTDTIVNGQASY